MIDKGGDMEAHVSVALRPPSILDSGRLIFFAFLVEGRCIIFTTHYLEEADILANRKAGWCLAGLEISCL